MPVKKKGKSTTKKGGGKGKSKKGGKKKGSSKGKKGKKKGAVKEKKTPPVPDPFSAAAMLNAYYISHGPVEFLAFRGYTSLGGKTDSSKKKKKGKKKK